MGFPVEKNSGFWKTPLFYFVFTKMLLISLSINRFPKFRILRWAEITYCPFPVRKRRQRVGTTAGLSRDYFFPSLVQFPSQGVPDPESGPRADRGFLLTHQSRVIINIFIYYMKVDSTIWKKQFILNSISTIWKFQNSVKVDNFYYMKNRIFI